MELSYRFTISLSPATVDALSVGNFSLLAFTPVQATAAGTPLVWIQSKAISTEMHVNWSPVYAAYVRPTPDTVGTGLPSSMAPILLGQMFTVLEDRSIRVTEDGSAGAMSILNRTDKAGICGLYKATEDPWGIVEFSLRAHSLIAVAPGMKVLFVFGSYPTRLGATLDRTFAQGAFVDFSDGPLRSATFDINEGWSFGGASWGETVPANTPLRELLIQRMPLALDQE
ncbi:MAG TPA: hypothetical protein VKB93_07495 [Thermoanaerobaculia bacterium]|nr:hypothetical protein [Thermoanaerobaculia bacterium]